MTRSQGYYHRPFTTTQKRRALEQGWRLTVLMKTDAGTAGAGTDFVGRGRRFDIQVLRDREIVRQEDIGPSLAAMVFESDSGSASFKSVRFEINP